MKYLNTDILVVGGGTGGTVAAIQAARRGINTIIVSETPWLGGMLTSAGVSAPDGNELLPFQTGIWGAFLRSLQQRQPGGLNNAWVSMFTYNPRIGAEIFADWVQELPNLSWIKNQIPREVLHQNNRVTGVKFADFVIQAKITLDGTELGDLLPLAEIPYRWGWELQAEFNEPSAPPSFNELTSKYPVQAPTWVVILQDYGKEAIAPQIPPPPHYNPENFTGAWDNYGAEKFLNYGRLPGNLLMLNWPISGNDYGVNLNRLVASAKERKQVLQEAYFHSQGFAHFIQNQLGRRYGLAQNIFPNHSAFALHPYYRESRRLQGKVTVTENNILFSNNNSNAIAIGNYPNDHHYPHSQFTLKPKSMRWGGRLTGTAFTIPYHSLIPSSTLGFIACEKNISVSHIANGCTRLQPVVMNIGQAAGMAAALCIELNCEPWELEVRKLQEALLTDSFAPAAIIPLLNLPPQHPDWLYWQLYYLNNPDAYPLDGNCPCQEMSFMPQNSNYYQLIFQKHSYQNYSTIINQQTWQLITLNPQVNEQFLHCQTGQLMEVWGQLNTSGNWLVVESLKCSSSDQFPFPPEQIS
ncbi:MAG: FAD-dependent oxidoreductase [Gomphosphaeria aponina SAG 52.96 = DSM 107014]|uniref:FAD-dependent oxidoreductase n=1 Tax=Gomphosphaeria aponina SAG 52.96 = DSM 107014 TaxID=1521640 RepID=A0A941JVM3_9CHRO|nr:FAD-dependent oxidoreductase [Gomphosphaeria aponina SAG 52.96 = DSM 107014]